MRWIIVTLCVLFCGTAAFAGVATTRHNLSATGPGTIKATSETGRCVFCHTPHGAINITDGPLWNHTMSSATYTVPSKSQPAWTTLLSTVGQPDKGAKLCLSCHDGTVAVGAVVNTPGPGSNSAGIAMAGVTGSGTIPSSAAGYLGINISGHHPVSIAVNDTLLADKSAQCSTGGSFSLSYPATTSPVKLRSTANLYKSAAGKNGNGVQCASCHDPHNDPNGKFLVTGTPVNNTPLCETCHILCP